MTRQVVRGYAGAQTTPHHPGLTVGGGKAMNTAAIFLQQHRGGQCGGTGRSSASCPSCSASSAGTASRCPPSRRSTPSAARRSTATSVPSKSWASPSPATSTASSPARACGRGTRPSSGGCRKLRWGAAGRGTRGGTRVIYFLRLASGQIVLVTMYAKNVREDIDPRLLRRIKEDFERG
jgi:hypothetical protein